MWEDMNQECACGYSLVHGITYCLVGGGSERGVARCVLFCGFSEGLCSCVQPWKGNRRVPIMLV